jgi:hypothetical protein
MNRRELKRKLGELQQAKQAGAKEEQEKERRERVASYLNGLLDARRERIANSPEDNRSPLQRARDEGDTEALERFEQIRQRREELRATGGGGRR